MTKLKALRGVNEGYFAPFAVELAEKVDVPIICVSGWRSFAADDGGIDARTYEIYSELAKGGVGAIITGFTSVAADDFYFGGMMRLSDDFLIPQYKRLVEIIYAENCPANC